MILHSLAVTRISASMIAKPLTTKYWLNSSSTHWHVKLHQLLTFLLCWLLQYEHCFILAQFPMHSTPLIRNKARQS